VSVGGKTFTFPGLFGTVSTTLTFNPDGTGGTFQRDHGGGSSDSGLIVGVNYQNNSSPYSSFLGVQLQIFSPNLVILFDDLSFRTANGGKFTGRSNLIGAATISGTFTSVP
jgi:hypothetical protein